MELPVELLSNKPAPLRFPTWIFTLLQHISPRNFHPKHFQSHILSNSILWSKRECEFSHIRSHRENGGGVVAGGTFSGPSGGTGQLFPTANLHAAQPTLLCTLSGVTFWCHSLVNRLVSSARAKNGVRNVQHCSCIAMCNMPICTVGAWKSVNVHIVIYFWQPQLHCLFHCGLICGCETNSEEETNSLKKSEEKNP